METLTPDDMATRLVALVMSNDNYPPKICADVLEFCKDVTSSEFNFELLKRRLSHEEI